MKKKIILIAAIILVLAIIGITLFLFTGKSVGYEIITNDTLIASFDVDNAQERGYEIVERDDTFYLVINWGEESQYYSKLEVTKVKVKGKVATVSVKLPKGEAAGDAFSYPKAVVRFDEEPSLVRVSFE